MNPCALVEVSLYYPGSGKVVKVCVKVDEHLFKKSFAPLPRDRELYFALDSQARAASQSGMRRRIARHLGEQLADGILRCAEKEDPHMGYSAQEWDAIQHPEKYL